jgi:hypothetical protein
MPSTEIEYYTKRAREEAERALDKSVPNAASVHATLAILYSARAFMLRAATGDLSAERGKMIA